MFILKLIIRWIILSAAVVLAEYIVPGIHLSGDIVVTALAVGLVLGLINAFIKPVLNILALPINFLTFGLFGLVLNVILFWAVTYVVPNFTIAGIVPAILGSIVVSIVMWIEHIIF
jgi:putative membrane protein